MKRQRPDDGVWERNLVDASSRSLLGLRKPQQARLWTRKAQITREECAEATAIQVPSLSCYPQDVSSSTQMPEYASVRARVFIKVGHYMIVHWVPRRHIRDSFVVPIE